MKHHALSTLTLKMTKAFELKSKNVIRQRCNFLSIRITANPYTSGPTSLRPEIHTTLCMEDFDPKYKILADP